jgi:hypothetical protein
MRVELTDDQVRELVALRGGCICFTGCAPCSRCCDPITEAEAERLGLELAPDARKAEPEVPPPVWDSRPIHPSGAMAAVRAMCGGAA